MKYWPTAYSTLNMETRHKPKSEIERLLDYFQSDGDALHALQNLDLSQIHGLSFMSMITYEGVPIVPPVVSGTFFWCFLWLFTICLQKMCLISCFLVVISTIHLLLHLHQCANICAWYAPCIRLRLWEEKMFYATSVKQCWLKHKYDCVLDRSY